MTTLMRIRGPVPTGGQMGPKGEDHASVGDACAACGMPFAVGDYTTLVAIGPGADEEARDRAVRGQPYNAVAVEVHWICGTGSSAVMD
jgi:hypothetical protein